MRISIDKNAKLKLKKGDEVVVLTGRSRGVEGKIEQIDKKKQKIFIAGKNLIKKHQKADMNNPGGIVEVPAGIHISNVALLDPKTKKATRVGFKKENNKNVRYAKKSGSILS